MGATAALLHSLLCQEEGYRRAWRARMARTPSSALQQSAVARVLAEHLWDTGLEDDSDEGLPRRLKDTVARALSGRSLSPRILELFVEAFDMSEAHRAALRASWEQEARRLGTLAPDTPLRVDPPVGSARTVVLHETHLVGPLGLPVGHCAQRLVRADTATSVVTCPLPPGTVAVTVLHGGTAGAPYAASGGMAVDVDLWQALTPGGTTLLEYRTVAVGRSPGRREVCSSLEGGEGWVSTAVRFDPARVPSRVCWQRWDVAGTVGRRGETLLGPGLAADLVLHEPGAGRIGFTWQW